MSLYKNAVLRNGDLSAIEAALKASGDGPTIARAVPVTWME